ncbi:unnamed protein product [Phytophthora lilii]|uniref:Unnamed protein product n=1 Tax=Phytophthora lilii TaxID=2077276 RepID=A0A9W6X6S2_9STRA|nr:unnamed protein product [Phytophthora lilii]
MFDFKLDVAGCQNHDGIDYSTEKERQEELKRLMMQNFLAKWLREWESASGALCFAIVTYPPRLNTERSRSSCRRLCAWMNGSSTTANDLLSCMKLGAPTMSRQKKKWKSRLFHRMRNILPMKSSQEKGRLLFEAYDDCNKLQFFLFIKRLARYGRGNIEAVAREMMKPLEEVEEESKVFLARGQDELSDWHKIMKSNEKGTRVFPSQGNEYGCREGHARLLCKD